jgi:hypothetical protein
VMRSLLITSINLKLMDLITTTQTYTALLRAMINAPSTMMPAIAPTSVSQPPPLLSPYYHYHHPVAWTLSSRRNQFVINHIQRQM